MVAQGSVPRDVPESPNRAKAKAKEAKKSQQGAHAPSAARVSKPSEDAQLLKKVIPFFLLLLAISYTYVAQLARVTSVI